MRLFADALFILVGGLVWVGSAVPRHFRFRYNNDSGVIELADKPALRLNVAGGKLQPGDPLVLQPCTPRSHENFIIKDDGLIALRDNLDFCLSLEGAVAAGARIVTGPCSQTVFGVGSNRFVRREASSDAGARLEAPFEQVQFVFGDDGCIRLRQHPDMCINVEGGEMQMGAKLILYPCSTQGPRSPNEVFQFNEGFIQLKEDRKLHFNVGGGDIQKPSALVLWGCQPAAHESFEFHVGRLRLRHAPEICINAEEGLGVGHRLIAWPCDMSSQVPAINERWYYDSARSLIYSTYDTVIGFAVKGKKHIQPGGEIVLRRNTAVDGGSGRSQNDREL